MRIGLNEQEIPQIFLFRLAVKTCFLLRPSQFLTAVRGRDEGGEGRDSCCLFNGLSTWCEVEAGKGGRTVPFLCLQKGHFETSISATQRIAVPPPTPALARAYRLHLFLPLLLLLLLLHVCSFRFHNTGLGKREKNLITLALHPLSSITRSLERSISPCLGVGAPVLFRVPTLRCGACEKRGSRRTTQRHVKHPPRPFRSVVSPPRRRPTAPG